MPPDLEGHMLKLAETATSGPASRVFVYRQILTAMWQQGFDAGMAAARQDRFVAQTIAEQEAEAEAPE